MSKRVFVLDAKVVAESLPEAPNRQIRSLVHCVDLSAPDGSGLLRLDDPSIQTAPDGSRLIVDHLEGCGRRPVVERERHRFRRPSVAAGPISSRAVQ
jgi:hypothetical protein